MSEGISINQNVGQPQTGMQPHQTIGKEVITKELILKCTSSYDILNYYLQPYHNVGRLSQGKNISNPFLATPQQTPSFNIYRASQSNEWRYKDFATGDEGSCFDLVMKLHYLDFKAALHKINSDLGLGLNGKPSQAAFRVSAPVPVVTSPKPFTVQKRDFNSEELSFWEKYGITDDTLQKFGVVAIAEFTTENSKGESYTVQSDAQQYLFGYEREEGMKVYKPLNRNGHKFQHLGTKQEGYVFGYDQLPLNGDKVFITGGEKDVMTLTAHGYPAITLNSETARLDVKLAEELQSRFADVLVLYDNDATGLKQSEALCKEHGLKRVQLPDFPEGKDISDFFAAGRTLDEMNLLIEEALVSAPLIDEDKDEFDGLEIIQLGSQTPQYLLAPLMPHIGTAVLAGKPDTGKSQFARQLCICVALGEKQFLGYDLNTTHHSSLYVATEDGIDACSYLYQQQLKGMGKDGTKNIRFLIADTYEQEEVLQRIDQSLTQRPADLVVVDSFGDIFKGNDGNNNMAMRNTVKAFDRIGKKHRCLILFVHHINKSAYRAAPSQEHIQGGAGLVQKVRLAMQLTQGEGQLKYLAIVKGNYTRNQYKKNAVELMFSEDTFLFTPTGRTVPVDKLGEQPKKGEEDLKYAKLKEQAEDIFDDKAMSYTEFVKAYEQVTGKSSPTAKRAINTMVEGKIVLKLEDGRYQLNNSDEEEPEE